VTGVYLDRISWALGDLARDVEAAYACGAVTSTPEQLRSAGFDTHHSCGEGTTAYDLGARAVRGMPGLPRRVGAILWASTLPQNATMGDGSGFLVSRDVKDLMRHPASRLQAELGFDDAFVGGVTQQACTGLLGALRLGSALLTSEPDLDPVLCLTADRFPEGASYEQAYNLVSDGAVACTLSRRPGPLRLLGVHHITNGALVDADDDQTVGAFFSYTCAVVEGLCERLGVEPGAIDWLVPQNTNVRVAPILARLLGIPDHRVHSPMVPDVGHLIAGDAFLNLSDLLGSGRTRPGQLVAVPIAGYGLNWQCAMLEVCATR
jgi:3-oxoacyl-[acyl-carrier-protein] synthase-3